MNLKIPKNGASDGGGRIKILFYSHDTMGLGHLQRNYKIATALKSACPRARISFLTGSTLTSHFESLPGFDFIHLPPVRKVGIEKYESSDPDKPFESRWQYQGFRLCDTRISFRAGY